MRNRQFIGYTLGPLERNIRGRLFDSVRGGGCQILFGHIIYFRHGLGQEFIFMGHGLGKIYYRVNMVNHSPLRHSLEIVVL